MSDSIFEEDELAADAAGAEGETGQTSSGQPRGEDGKFVAKQPEEGAGEGDAGEGEAGDKPGGTVPQGALHAERERRKAVEAELAAARDTLAQIQKFREAAKAKQPEALPGADDPAALEHLRQRLGQVETQQTQFVQREQMAAADQAEIMQLQSVMASSEQAFRAEKPDYDAAIQHVMQARAQELTLYGLSPLEIQQTIAEEATEIARTAVRQARNPAEMGYSIALARGYRPGAVGEGQQPQNGDAAAKLNAIAQAQGASKSLGAGGGSAPQALNAEAIAAMSSEEFEALYSTAEGRKLIDAL